MRETGWSLSVTGVGMGGELTLVKILLLRAVMHDDNLANNGEILLYSGLLITREELVLKSVVQYRYLRTRNIPRQYRGKSI